LWSPQLITTGRASQVGFPFCSLGFEDRPLLSWAQINRPVLFVCFELFYWCGGLGFNL
jgi:hypothetical protein